MRYQTIAPYADYYYNPNDDYDELITEKAYELAEEAGEDADDDWFHWCYLAEKALLAEDRSSDFDY